MMKALNVLRVILLTEITLCLIILGFIVAERYGKPITLQEALPAYIVPVGLAVLGIVLFRLVDTHLKMMEEDDMLYAVVMLLSSGECLLELDPIEKNGKVKAVEIKYHTDVMTLIQQFKSIFDVASTVDYELFTKGEYVFNLMRPYIIAIPRGSGRNWAIRFALTKESVSLTIPKSLRKLYYLRVSSEILKYNVLDVVQSIADQVYQKEEETDIAKI